jgi:hypothetical protein
LYVYDYKHGKRPVAAADNVQLKYYALGALGPDNPMMVDRVVCKIIQPNCWGKDPVDVWDTTTAELYAWGRDVLAPAAAATESPDAPCVAGPWCHFCEAEGLCPAKAQQALELLDATPLQDSDAEVAPQEVTLPAAALLTPDQLGRMCSFFLSDAFADWLKALAAEEYALLQRGVAVPGRKLVEYSRTGNRQWTDERAARSELVTRFGEDALEVKLKSPAQLEKWLTSQGIPKKEREELFGALVVRPPVRKMIVVPDTDPRASVATTYENDVDLFD